ncbi:uncharacterized protein PgNI_03648 [Pyricularia grisea]|uniref:Inner centromere protein ARK-binding domain-containing protein n=1 Tax=Pyricularia grisea TaxID=148305 RepID=A0A6P8B962_PYRGI|nr:uncharacterized protein PgNI_03648 [Pyricularia grisea]TLD12187.1 hypothetical protein PgNI_03648 [Pyricularia grisea]
MAMRGPRQPVGSATWIAEERASATQISRSEAEEFTFSVRNEFEWLNEHMNGIFDENQQNLVDVFKTPGKLRGRTPRTARKPPPTESRAPLSDVFSATPKAPNTPFGMAVAAHAQTPKLKVAEDNPRPPVAAAPSPARAASPHKATTVSSPKPPPPKLAAFSQADSGYGSQSQPQPQSQQGDVVDTDVEMEDDSGEEESNWQVYPETDEDVPNVASPDLGQRPSLSQPTGESSFHSAKEEQTKFTKAPSPLPPPEVLPQSPPVRSPSPVHSPMPASPQKSSPLKPASPQKQSPQKPAFDHHSPSIVRKPLPAPSAAALMDKPSDEASPSDASSPIRPIVRKSSLNFASLPAREPLGATKSIGARMSRTSHLDQTRQSYYNRPTGGKSLGNTRHENEEDDEDEDEEDDQDEMDIDDELSMQKTTNVEAKVAAHNKTYTQRLQDQISMLGKSQSSGSRPSKSLVNVNVLPQAAMSNHVQPTQSTSQQPAAAERPPTPPRKDHMTTPGAFPEDDEEDWIALPAAKQQPVHSPRPVMTKSHTTDVMESFAGKDTVGGSDFLPSAQEQQGSFEMSPKRAPVMPDKSTGTPGHSKSASVPFLPSNASLESEVSDDTSSPLKKAISVSNPTALATVHEGDRSSTPKSPSRSFRDSPLKQVKNKLSSILKSSKGLLASSAAVSAEGKASLLSPSSTRLGMHFNPSVESLAPRPKTAGDALYPDLSQHLPLNNSNPSRPGSPVRANTRKTRASAEREKRELEKEKLEQKQREKAAKEAQRAAKEMNMLEKARELEREKARAFNQEQERKQLEAKKEQERIEAHQRAEARRMQERMEEEARRRPASPVKETPRVTRSSPRKGKGQAGPSDRDVDMADAPSMMPPPSVPRSAVQSKSAIRRPVAKPSKETLSKSKQAPTVIRVNTTSQHPRAHPSTSVLSATLQDTLGPQSSQLKSKPSVPNLQKKPSVASFKSSVASTGRPKALEQAAARKKEVEEREAEAKRQAKLEKEKKREREQQQRLEVERQKEEERRQAAAAQAEARKAAARQAILEKAKQTKAPPPPQRSQQNGRPDHSTAGGSIPRPASRLDAAMRSQDDLSRPYPPGMASAAKPAPKRPLQQDEYRQGQQKAGPSFKESESKRMRFTDEWDADELEMGGVMNVPPVRPSNGFKKDLPNNKSHFSHGYTNASQSQSATRDLFKAAVENQHNANVKATHPLGMAQVSKGPIPFAQSQNGAGPSTHKTPARPGAASQAKSAAKSATRSSPRFQNGEAIELPEIQTDEDDSDEEDQVAVADWANSPDLRRALMRQETIDPMQVFGPPAPINMEEVFKGGNRQAKFRARTSSANWDGGDRLTEEDIRKDLIAREKIRREGGWSYDLGRDTP